MALKLYHKSEQKPSAQFKGEVDNTFRTFLYIVLYKDILNGTIRTDKIDNILEMITNFCNAHDIGTRWIKNHLEPTMRGLVKKNTKSIRFNFGDISDMLKEIVLDRYTENDPFNLKNERGDNCVQLSHSYRNPILKGNKTHNITYGDYQKIIKHIGAEEYRDELMRRAFFKYQINRTYQMRLSLDEFIEQFKKECEETGNTYIGIIELERDYDIKEDEAFIYDENRGNGIPSYVGVNNFRAYTSFWDNNMIRYGYGGLRMF